MVPRLFVVGRRRSSETCLRCDFKLELKTGIHGPPAHTHFSAHGSLTGHLQKSWLHNSHEKISFFCICQCQRFWKVLFDIKCFYLWLLKWFSFFCIPCVYHWVPFVSILFGSVQNKLEWKEFLFRKLRNLWTRHWTECSIDQRSGGRRRPKELKNKSQNIRIRVKHSCEHHQTCHNTSFNSGTGHFSSIRKLAKFRRICLV